MGSYIEAPEEFEGDGPSLFLAGGITACLDWQSEWPGTWPTCRLPFSTRGGGISP
jgi:hypothetical protein